METSKDPTNGNNNENVDGDTDGPDEGPEKEKEGRVLFCKEAPPCGIAMENARCDAFARRVDIFEVDT